MPTVPDPRPGRPRASSRQTLAEAACELFLEQGYPATSVGDITARAGVSRSSFFNYFASKGDILWGEFDERAEHAVTALTDAGGSIRSALQEIARDLRPDPLALAIANADAMGIGPELHRERAQRQTNLGDAVAEALRARGVEELAAQIRGAAAAAAVFASLWAWADAGAGTTRLEDILRRALEIALAPPADGTGGVA